MIHNEHFHGTRVYLDKHSNSAQILSSYIKLPVQILEAFHIKWYLEAKLWFGTKFVVWYFIKAPNAYSRAFNITHIQHTVADYVHAIKSQKHAITCLTAQKAKECIA